MPKGKFTPQQKDVIARAIEQAEQNTSGEIRVYAENICKGDVLDRAANIFAMLKMHKTKLRNGVLFYLALQDHKFAILGDAGINSVTPHDFWDSIKDSMLVHFKEGNYTQALVTGVGMAGEKLKEHFPHQRDDVNELPNEISFGK